VAKRPSDGIFQHVTMTLYSASKTRNALSALRVLDADWVKHLTFTAIFLGQGWGGRIKINGAGQDYLKGGWCGGTSKYREVVARGRGSERVLGAMPPMSLMGMYASYALGVA
jgi:hypothetical protein